MNGKQLRIAKEAAEEALRIKSQFLADLSHEIRTPMTVIVGMSELILETGLDGHQRELAATIRNCAQNLLVVLDDTLDFSAIEAGKVKLDETSFSVEKLLGDMADYFSEKARRAKIELVFDSPSSAAALITGPGGRLRQVVVNLIGNALKFTKPGGTVLVQAETLAETQDEMTISLSVKDSGIGIAPEAVAKLFQPFSQADSADNKQYGGTGLGLAISRKIIEAMGGHIDLDTKPGVGSTFHFAVQLRKQAVSVDWRSMPSGTTKGQGVAEHPSLRVLVVEDNPANQLVTLLLLKKLGHDAQAVDNGRQAVNCLKLFRFDLIFMDCHMPEMDGFEATANIRQMDLLSGRHTPIVALTANALEGDRRNCLVNGMDDYLPKPVETKDLDGIISKVGAYAQNRITQ